MALREITDENELRELNGQQNQAQKKRLRLITDENSLRQLNAPEQESTLKSAAMAIPRIGYDIGESAIQGLQRVPGLIEKAQTEIPGYPSTLLHHPLHMGKQANAGLAELIFKTANKPYDIANYAANRLNLLPKAVPEFLEKHGYHFKPEEVEQSVNQMFGKPEYPGEEMVRGGFRNLDVAIPGVAALNKIAPFRTKKYFSNELLKAHDALEDSATKGFNKVSDEVIKRKLPHFNVDPYEIDSLREYFPKTKAYGNLIDKAMTGDYEALRKLQSDLYTKGKKNINSPLAAESDRGYEMFEKRNDINDQISRNLKDMGQNDLSDILDTSKGQWRQLQQIYYNKDLSPTLRKMFNPDVRRIPGNVTKLLSEESIPVNELLDAHPTLRDKLINYNRKNSALKLGGTAAGIGGLGTLGALIYDKLLRNNK